MLENVTQEEIATRLGISPGAVSQRVRRQGIAALVRVDEMLGQVR
jgi:predicted transcriptional regulator